MNDEKEELLAKEILSIVLQKSLPIDASVCLIKDKLTSHGKAMFEKGRKNYCDECKEVCENLLDEADRLKEQRDQERKDRISDLESAGKEIKSLKERVEYLSRLEPEICKACAAHSEKLLALEARNKELTDALSLSCRKCFNEGLEKGKLESHKALSVEEIISLFPKSFDGWSDLGRPEKEKHWGRLDIVQAIYKAMEART